CFGFNSSQSISKSNKSTSLEMISADPAAFLFPNGALSSKSPLPLPEARPVNLCQNFGPFIVFAGFAICSSIEGDSPGLPPRHLTNASSSARPGLLPGCDFAFNPMAYMLLYRLSNHEGVNGEKSLTRLF